MILWFERTKGVWYILRTPDHFISGICLNLSHFFLSSPKEAFLCIYNFLWFLWMKSSCGVLDKSLLIAKTSNRLATHSKSEQFFFLVKLVNDVYIFSLYKWMISATRIQDKFLPLVHGSMLMFHMIKLAWSLLPQHQDLPCSPVFL